MSRKWSMVAGQNHDLNTGILILASCLHHRAELEELVSVLTNVDLLLHTIRSVVTCSVQSVCSAVECACRWAQKALTLPED